MAAILQRFGVEERAFILRKRGWRELEKARDSGLGEIAARLAPLVALTESGLDEIPGALLAAIGSGHFGAARLDDVREPILQALIDGGLGSTIAGALVATVFDEATDAGRGPLMTWAPLSFRIVVGAMIGLPDEPQVGEPKGATGRGSRRSRTARPASPSSTPLSP